jgi:hypothetical protein
LQPVFFLRRGGPRKRKELSVAIIGGGIGGMAAALLNGKHSLGGPYSFNRLSVIALQFSQPSHERRLVTCEVAVAHDASKWTVTEDLSARDGWMRSVTGLREDPYLWLTSRITLNFTRAKLFAPDVTGGSNSREEITNLRVRNMSSRESRGQLRAI